METWKEDEFWWKKGILGFREHVSVTQATMQSCSDIQWENSGHRILKGNDNKEVKKFPTIKKRCKQRFEYMCGLSASRLTVKLVSIHLTLSHFRVCEIEETFWGNNLFYSYTSRQRRIILPAQWEVASIFPSQLLSLFQIYSLFIIF